MQNVQFQADINNGISDALPCPTEATGIFAGKGLLGRNRAPTPPPPALDKVTKSSEEDFMW